MRKRQPEKKRGRSYERRKRKTPGGGIRGYKKREDAPRCTTKPKGPPGGVETGEEEAAGTMKGAGKWEGEKI